MENTMVVQRLSYLESERSNAQERWDAIETFIAPYRGDFFRQNAGEQGVELDKSQVFDGTALQSSQTLAANLHGNLTSAYVQWFGLQFRSKELKEDADAREWLEECAAVVWQTLQESNFSREVAEAYLDLTTFATTFLFEEAKEETEWDGAVFNSIPLKESYFEEDAEGKIHTFYRKLLWTPLQIVDKFGEDVPSEIKDKASGATATSEKIEVVFVVWPRFKKKGSIQAKKLPPKRRPYGCKYMLRRDGASLGKESGYYEMPVFATRWAKVSESKWGHGPSHVAIYDVQALNRQEMLTLQALEKVVDPPQKTTERGVIGDVDLQPGGLTVLRNIDDLKPMTFGTEWNVLNTERQNRRAMIREYYMISKLDLKDSPAMTATEVERRWQQMQKLLGPTLGRLQADLLGPCVELTFALLLRAGQLPEMPDVVAAAGNAKLDLEFTGPLPVAQKADVAAAIERELGLASNLAATYGPDVLDAIDSTKALQEHARLTAVPAKILRTDVEIKKKRKEREAQQQQAAGMQQMEAAAGAAKDMGAGMKSMAEAKGAGDNVIQMPGTEAA